MGRANPPSGSPATRRGDALADICRHFLDHQHTRRAGRHRPHLNLVLDIERYRALPAAGARSVDGTRLDRTSTDRLLCDAAVHRVLSHGRSAILDFGTATRTIPAPLSNILAIRDGHCRFPGCDRPTTWCEGHHVRPWQAGGPTNLANLVLLCSRHHHLLHAPGWHAKLLPDATLEVTDPTGHVRSGDPPATGRGTAPTAQGMTTRPVPSCRRRIGVYSGRLTRLVACRSVGTVRGHMRCEGPLWCRCRTSTRQSSSAGRRDGLPSASMRSTSLR
jgi:hypothetical protein